MNRRTWMPGAGAAIAGITALAGGFVVYRWAHAETRDGAALRAVVLPDAHGNERALEQWRGKLFVVNFWAAWCAPCREEMPDFIAAQRNGTAKGLQLVGIAVDQANKVRQFAKAIGLNYSTLMGG